jgi:hypothetical protein
MQPSRDAQVNGARLLIDADVIARDFDRRPFRFTHNLSGLDEFSNDSLRQLTREFDRHPRDFFVSAGAPSADTKFFSVAQGMCSASEAFDRLDSGAYRILLKRAENHDARFRRLLDNLFAQVMEARGGLRGERLLRLESGIFITSAASTTPVHFDPEINFFTQIEGEKTYHVYNPATVPEADLERFYLQGQVSIGNVNLQACKPEQENVYTLTAGSGFHQPQNSPHWVKTQGSRSISYAFVFETDASRARGRTRAYNYYLRKFGLVPSEPGKRPAVDAVKAGAMRWMIPARSSVGATLRSILRR